MDCSNDSTFSPTTDSVCHGMSDSTLACVRAVQTAALAKKPVDTLWYGCLSMQELCAVLCVKFERELTSECLSLIERLYSVKIGQFRDRPKDNTRRTPVKDASFENLFSLLKERIDLLSRGWFVDPRELALVDELKANISGSKAATGGGIVHVETSVGPVCGGGSVGKLLPALVLPMGSWWMPKSIVVEKSVESDAPWISEDDMLELINSCIQDERDDVVDQTNDWVEEDVEEVEEEKD